MLTRDQYRLRPMAETDLRTVLRWRNSARVRAVSFGDHEIAWDEHVAWFARSQADDSASLLIFERSAIPCGVVNFTGIDRDAGSCEWSFYLGDPELPKGTGTVMGFFALERAFAGLDLDRVVARTFLRNQASVRYHDRLGFREIPGGRTYVEKEGAMLEVVSLEILIARWRSLRDSLARDLFSERAGLEEQG